MDLERIRGTAAVAVAGAVGDGQIKIIPDVLTDGGDAGGTLTGLATAVTPEERSRDWSPR